MGRREYIVCVCGLWKAGNLWSQSRDYRFYLFFKDADSIYSQIRGVLQVKVSDLRRPRTKNKGEYTCNDNAKQLSCLLGVSIVNRYYDIAVSWQFIDLQFYYDEVWIQLWAIINYIYSVFCILNYSYTSVYILYLTETKKYSMYV